MSKIGSIKIDRRTLGTRDERRPARPGPAKPEELLSADAEYQAAVSLAREAASRLDAARKTLAAAAGGKSVLVTPEGAYSIQDASWIGAKPVTPHRAVSEFEAVRSEFAAMFAVAEERWAAVEGIEKALLRDSGGSHVLVVHPSPQADGGVFSIVDRNWVGPRTPWVASATEKKHRP